MVEKNRMEPESPRTDPPQVRRRARRNTGRVTLSDLARLTGVTKVTVSRALNTPELVSEKTLERVREAVRQTGYTPNLIAGSLASSRSRLVVALIPSVAGGVFREAVKTLTDELEAAGYQLLLGQSGYGEAREEALLDAVIGRQPAGLLLTGVVHSERSRRKLRAAGIPLIEIWETTDKPIDMLIGFSHPEIGKAAAELVKRRGAKFPAVIAPNDRRALMRAEAFVEACGGHATVPMKTVPSPAVLGDGRRGLAELLEHHPSTDAVFCAADIIALGVSMEANKRRLRIPEQIRIIGYGDQRFASDTDPPLTTIRVDGTRIGRLAASMLMTRIEGHEVAERYVDIGFTIVERNSA